MIISYFLTLLPIKKREENVLTVDVIADSSQYGWKYFDAESSPIVKKEKAEIKTILMLTNELGFFF